MMVGAVTLGLSMTFSFVKSMLIITRDTEHETEEEVMERNQEASHIQYAGFVNAIGFITYLMILSGYGRMVWNGEEFIYIQYIEWIISTPIIVIATYSTSDYTTAVYTTINRTTVSASTTSFESITSSA
jgi:bacteriorhodopsin